MKIQTDVNTYANVPVTNAVIRLEKIVLERDRAILQTRVRVIDGDGPHIRDVIDEFTIENPDFTNLVIPRITGVGSLIAGARTYIKNQYTGTVTDLDDDTTY